MFETIIPLEDAHEIWATLEERYDHLNLDEDDLLTKETIEEYSTSTSNQEELPIASTSTCMESTHPSSSLTCEKAQGKDMEIEACLRQSFGGEASKKIKKKAP